MKLTLHHVEIPYRLMVSNFFTIDQTTDLSKFHKRLKTLQLGHLAWFLLKLGYRRLRLQELAANSCERLIPGQHAEVALE